MHFTATVGSAPPFEFECLDNLVSRWVCGDVLSGQTYPHLGGPWDHHQQSVKLYLPPRTAIVLAPL